LRKRRTVRYGQYIWHNVFTLGLLQCSKFVMNTDAMNSHIKWSNFSHIFPYPFHYKCSCILRTQIRRIHCNYKHFFWTDLPYWIVVQRRTARIFINVSCIQDLEVMLWLSRAPLPN